MLEERQMELAMDYKSAQLSWRNKEYLIKCWVLNKIPL